jgi:hypothetical protein
MKQTQELQHFAPRSIVGVKDVLDNVAKDIYREANIRGFFHLNIITDINISVCQILQINKL